MRFLDSPRRALLAGFAALLVAILLLPAGAAAATTSLGCADDATGTTDLSSWVPEMLEATNAHRTSMGLVPLQLDPVLTRASVWKSRDLGRRNYFDHDDLALPGESSRSPWERLADCGWRAGGSRAENIAAGQQSGRAFITAWLNSPGHRANIENASMRYVGFGVARVTGSRYGTYATQMFASVPSGEVAPPPPPAPPAAPTTTSMSLDYEGSAKLVCPASGSGITYVVDAVQGQVDATSSGACVRVAPRAGVGGVTAAVDYHARGAEGGVSPVVRMTVTVAAAPPPPPPAAPSVASLSFAYQGATRVVCPSASEVAYALDSVQGWVVAGITDAGCLRVSPVSGKGGITAYVSYHATHPLGGSSPTTRMTVTVAAAPAPEPTPDPTPDPTPVPDPTPDPTTPPTDSGPPDPDPVPPTVDPAPPTTDPAPPATDPTPPTTDPVPPRWRGVRVDTERFRCWGRLAVRGWCWRLVVTARLVDAEGSAVRGARGIIQRRTATGRWTTVCTDTTDRSGTLEFSLALRPLARVTVRWLAAQERGWRLVG